MHHALSLSLVGVSPPASLDFACHKNSLPQGHRFFGPQAVLALDGDPQECFRLSRGANDAPGLPEARKTDSDHIAQAKPTISVEYY